LNSAINPKPSPDESSNPSEPTDPNPRPILNEVLSSKDACTFAMTFPPQVKYLSFVGGKSSLMGTKVPEVVHPGFDVSHHPPYFFRLDEMMPASALNWPSILASIFTTSSPNKPS
jgi:hypothetical protein